jgi:hypothetical protein
MRNPLYVTVYTYIHIVTFICLGAVFSLTVANLILVYQDHHCFCVYHCTVLSLCLVLHTIFSHTNTVHPFSSQPHGSFQLHFSQTALPNSTITILCRLELQGCLGHNVSRWFYSFLKGMRERKVDRDFSSFESEVQAAGMWSPPPLETLGHNVAIFLKIINTRNSYRILVGKSQGNRVLGIRHG